MELAEIRRYRIRAVGPVALSAGLNTADQHLVLKNQLFAEDKVGYRAGERAHGEEDHAPGYPLGPVTLAAIVRQ